MRIVSSTLLITYIGLAVSADTAASSPWFEPRRGDPSHGAGNIPNDPGITGFK